MTVSTNSLTSSEVDSRCATQFYLQAWTPRKGKPLDLDDVIAQIARVVKSFNCWSLWCDYHSKGWIESYFSRHGITTRFYDNSGKRRRKVYDAFELALNRGSVILLDDLHQERELKALIRKPNGRVDHLKSQHDDRAVAVALCSTVILSGPAGSIAVPRIIEERAPTMKPGIRQLDDFEIAERFAGDTDFPMSDDFPLGF